MKNRFGPFWWIVLPTLIVVLVDIYVFQAVKNSVSSSKPTTQRLVYLIFWGLSSFTYLALLILLIGGYSKWYGWSKILIVGIAQAVFFSKLLVVPFLLIDDLLRVFRWLFNFLGNSTGDEIQPNGISRLQFLSRSGLLIGSAMFGALIYGVLRGAYNYQIKKIKLKIANLPKEWEGLKIVQISDWHLGSFANSMPVKKIVELVNAQQADIIFFTGDLVNYKAMEVLPFLEELKQLRAKINIYSILGNHDYGTYVEWNSKQEMHDNLQQLKKIQLTDLGWDLLLDEHRILERNGKKLAIIGVQYIGRSLHFGEIGNLNKAYLGAETADVQLLLSHDPSHWDKDVSVEKNYSKIQATFAGHTHGFQFGIEIPGLRWSPAQYVYPHWAGLYKNKNTQQQLYVNRGIGFLGYPGRLGISPEITVFQLTNENANS